MWRTELDPTVKRLEKKLHEARQQLQEKDTPTTSLQVSLSILTKLTTKLNELKADADAASTKKRKAYDDSEFIDLTELLLDAEEMISELEILVGQSNRQQTPPLARRNSGDHLTSNNTRLPKLDLKKFGGDITTFQEFWQTFEIAVDKTSLDDIQKFVYLKTLLNDEAEKLIAGFTTTRENYKIAKNLLQEKYGNTQLVVQQLYQRLNSVPQATKHTLRQTYDTLESLLRSLETAKENIEGGALLSILSKKYPDEILLQVFEKTSAEDLSVSLLRTTVKEIVTQREKLALLSTPTTSREKVFATTEALFTHPKSHGKFSKTCRYCEKSHYSDSCEEYSTVEKRKEKIKGSCFVCLKEGHNFRKCRTVKPCVYCKKVKNHHRSLCPQQFANKKETEENPKGTQPTVTCLSTSNTLLTASTIARSGSKSKKIRLIFDNGSARSYITENLFRKFGIQSDYNEALEISTFAKQKPVLVNTKAASVELLLNNGDYFSISVNTIPFICSNINVKYSDQVKKIARKQKLQLADNETEADVDMLIGLDYYFHFVTEERIATEESFLVKSTLGWLVAGKVKTTLVKESNVPCFLVKEDNIRQLWELDTIGIKIEKHDKDEDEALLAFYSTITFSEGRYTVSWPWKVTPPDLPSNYKLSYGRLKTLVKRLNPSLLQRYDKIIQQQCENGIVEKTEKASSNLCHYLPHHPVETPGKSTECRIVYDGSAKTRKTNNSLNDCLYKGKVLLEHICTLLLRFRFNKFAMIADIEKAFLQIGLHPNERDTTRFLWLKDINKDLSEENLQIFRFKKIPFGVISSPFLLSATIHYHLTNSKLSFASKLLPDFYVDNLVTGVMNINEGKQLYAETKKSFSEASMNLRSWKSNSQELNETFSKNSDYVSNEKISVLGIIWNTTTDTLAVKSSISTESCTKRQILQASSAVFDPMGWYAPVTLPAKLLIKKLWHLNVEWDEPLSESEAETWKKIWYEISLISTHELPRFILNAMDGNSKHDIHVFVDASQEAYGAVAYLKTENNNLSAVSILFAKSRVAPAKGTLTIPRLELLAALIGVRMLAFLKASISRRIAVSEYYLWSDSRCVLSWVISKKVLPSFVENRVREIRQHSDIVFRYVPSHLNPADLSSRGCAFNQLENSYWWNGPPFLRLTQNKWPHHETEEITPFHDEINTTSALCSQVSQPLQENGGFMDMQIENFPTLQELLDITVYRFRAGKINNVTDNITSDESRLATIWWIQYTQQKYFPDITSSKSFCSFQKKKLKNQFGLWKDLDGIWRCKGRIIFAELSEDEKFPVLLPNEGKFVTLLILHYHTNLHHAGVAQTLCELRKSYWILKGRAKVYHTLKKACVNCTYFQAYPYKTPPEPPLPTCRVTKKLPFSTTGLDVFGPLYVDSRKNNKPQKKVWCLLFTCLLTRAVHLELLDDLTTEEFILSFRSFVARRRKPELCLSDNAPQFKLTDTIFKKMCQRMLSSEATQLYFNKSRITWKYIPPSAPWMGGTWERIVGIVKTALKKTLFKTSITKGQLKALLTEIEAVVNSRPLLYVGGQFPDEVLTPARLLGHDHGPDHTAILISEEYAEPETIETETTAAEKRVVELWKKTANLVQHFWKTWSSSYLQNLRERYTIHRRRHSAEIPQVGAVVLVHDEILPRIRWTTAKIVELLPSADGEIRSAKIETNKGNIIIRPIIKLYPLGLEFQQNDTVPTTVEQQEDVREEFELESFEVEEIDDD